MVSERASKYFWKLDSIASACFSDIILNASSQTVGVTVVDAVFGESLEVIGEVIRA